MARSLKKKMGIRFCRFQAAPSNQDIHSGNLTAIENGPVETVDLPTKNGDFP